jgi:lipid-binding SYLF domain-containing protein
MRFSLLCAAACAAAFLFLGGCATAPETSTERADLTNDAQAALADFRAQDPSLDNVLNNSYGYAIFPSVGKGAAGIGGAYGQGEVFQQGNRVGYTDMTQATVGAALGGQSFAELIVFRTREALENFEAGQTTFTADASAVAINSGAAANAKWAHDVVVFTYVKGGLMADAAIGGQSFKYEARQQPQTQPAQQ